MNRYSRAAGDFLFKYRGVVFPLVGAALLLLPLAPEHSTNVVQQAMRPTSIIILLIGLALRAAVVGFAKVRHTGRQGVIFTDVLFTRGLFALCRNPLYLANLLICAGLLLQHGNGWAVMIGMTAFTMFYIAIIEAEENFLFGRFGVEYDAYHSRVPRLIPDLRNVSAAFEGLDFDWRRIARRESAIIVGGLAGWVALEFFKEVAEYPAEFELGEMSLQAAFVVLCGIGLLTRRITKTRCREAKA